jgi:(1->4)-alpha-D-glucan 1-alpha-D-glucosylmutase
VEYQDFRQRISDYMLKAVKEAKLHTRWLNPNQEYEEAVRYFVEKVLQPNPRSRFLNALAPLARLVAYFGHFNSLSQTLLKLTTPGFPDIYQGNELWDFSLVDPDNRRAVDYDHRRSLLKELMNSKGKRTGQRQLIQDLVKGWPDGRIKLFVIQRTLRFRRQHPDLFAGGYVPLETSGAAAQHLCAYLRQNQAGEQFLVIVPRLAATLTERTECTPVGEDIWGDTQILLPDTERGRSYSNLFTGAKCSGVNRGGKATLAAAELLADFPLALLTTAS